MTLGELQQRSYTADVPDRTGRDREVTYTVYERENEQGMPETQWEDFELDGEAVSYADLARELGGARTRLFMEEAEEGAR